jgi:glycosyltransferase involved in cell wall biosynthesis
VRVILSSNFSPWSAYTGGAPRSTHYLATELSRRGHHVTVIFTKVPWERIEPGEPTLYDLRWATLLNPGSGRVGPLRPFTACTVAKIARRLLEDFRKSHGEETAIVHANGEEGALLPRLRRRLPFGLVVTPRYPALPAALNGQSPTSPLRRLATLVRQPKYATLGVALRGADYCSPPSAYAAQLFQRAYGLDPGRVRPVHNGVPGEFLNHHWRPASGAPGTPGTIDRRPILFFGRFSHSKGVDVLLEAFAGINRIAAQHLVLVGSGPHRARYLDRIRALKLDDRVQLREWATHQDLAQLLTSSSIAVLPSREENFSLAVLSAMAVGIPLVTTAVGGTPEVVKHGKNGLLCEPGNASQLRDAMNRLLADPAYASELGTAGCELVRRSFTWEAAARKFEELYATLSVANRLSERLAPPRRALQPSP